MSLNHCQFLGYLGSDPETRHTTSGASVTTFSVACGEKWKDKNTGEEHERTEWVRCVMYGNRGETVAKYFSKGSQIFVSGKMQTRDYEKDGIKHYMTEIICDRFEFINNQKSEQTPTNANRSTPTKTESSKTVSPPVYQDFDDDVPF